MDASSDARHSPSPSSRSRRGGWSPALPVAHLSWEYHLVTLWSRENKRTDPLRESLVIHPWCTIKLPYMAVIAVHLPVVPPVTVWCICARQAERQLIMEQDVPASHGAGEKKHKSKDQYPRRSGLSWGWRKKHKSNNYKPRRSGLSWGQ